MVSSSVNNTVINNLNTINSSQSTIDKKSIQPNGDSFSSFLEASMSVVSETNDLQNKSTVAQMDYVTGKNDNMLDLILSQEEALTSLNFTVQVTNKVIDAYRELMQVQL